MAHTWFYNSVSGLVQHETNALLQAALDHSPTWHGFDTKAAADAYKKAHPASLGAIGDATTTAEQVASPVKIEGFLSALTQRATWLRVSEVIIGAALIIVGLVKLASREIPTAAKVAALL